MSAWQKTALVLAVLLMASSAYAQTSAPTGPAPAFPHPDGSNCASGEAARGTDEEGNAQDCFAAGTGFSTSAELAALLSDETGTGFAVFSISPEITLFDSIDLSWGDDGDATIRYDGTNLLINPQFLGSGYTDFTGAIFVAQDEDVFSRLGPSPTHLTDTNARDKLVATKMRVDTTGNIRAGLFVAEDGLDGGETITNRATFGINAIVYGVAGANMNNSNSDGAGGAAGGRYWFEHRGGGTYAMAGGVASKCKLGGGVEDGIISDCYAFLDEGGDGGLTTRPGEITRYHSYWVMDVVAGTEVLTKYGLHVENLQNATVASIGIQLDGAADGALWFNTDTAADAMTFWGLSKDTNLYREAADFLKTDDDFIVGKGVLFLGETTTPTPIADTGAIYTKSDNLPFFQSGNGVEHGLALLDSPIFTGDPTAPTPVVTDNDTSLATTAFVSSALDRFHVVDYGALCDGSTVDTVAIQDTFDAADAATVPAHPSFFRQSTVVTFPAGNCLTGTITWKGQSIRGVGSGDSIITGRGSEDILFADPASFPSNSPTPFRIEGITFNVDDTTDASGSFDRHGVGNAAIAVEFDDGSGDKVGAWIECMFNDVRFRSTSLVGGGRNSSAGEYFQGIFKQSCKYTNVRYRSLEYSLYEDYPTLNVTSAEIFRDYNLYENLFVFACENGPRFVNNQSGSISGSQIGGFNKGLVVTGVTSQNRTASSEMLIGPWFAEQASGTTGINTIQIDGRDHVLLDITSISNVNDSKVTLNANGSTWVGGFFANANNASPLTVAGDENNISGLILATPTIPIVNTGDRNTIEIARYQGGQGSGGVQLLVNEATPSVLGHDKWRTGGTITITDFDDGYEGKILTVISEHAVTIEDGTDIVLNGSADFVTVPTDTLTLVQKADGNWYEISRSASTPYGACQGMEIGWTQANAVQNQWYDISDADFVDTQLNGVTHDGNGQLTVLKDGMYAADWAGAFEADAAGVHIQITFSVNGTPTDFGMNHFKTIAVLREFPIAAPTILDLAAGDTVNVALRTSDASTPDLLVDHLLIRLFMIGGT